MLCVCGSKEGNQKHRFGNSKRTSFRSMGVAMLFLGALDVRGLAS